MMNKKRSNFWKKQLKDVHSCSQIVISSESFSNNILRPGNIQFLTEIAESANMRLNIIYFVRDQADLINSHYCHGIRRFYRSNTFNDFLSNILQRDQTFHEKGYDLDSRFSMLLDKKNFKLSFIPLTSNKNPFLSIAELLQWPSDIELELTDSSINSNSQPGCKGIWLSRMAYDICQRLNHPVDKLKNRGNVIRNIAIKNDWTMERFYGFDDSSYNLVKERYEAGNNRFAQRVWGKNWSDVISCKQKEQNIFNGPTTQEEYKKLKRSLLFAFKKMEWKHKQSKLIGRIFKDLAYSS